MRKNALDEMAKKYENPPLNLTTTTTTATNDGDSDEDCEVYFLKPVNEYNITEKIKEANKELFANNGGLGESDSYDEGATLEAGNINRKVTFALNLEDYEPSAEDVAEAAAAETEATELHTKLARDFKFPAIEEEDDSIEGIKSMAEGSNKMALTDTTTTNGRVDDDQQQQLVEEICEEIIIMDMEEQTTQRVATDVTETQQPQQHGRRQIVKQNTFAFEDDCVATEQQLEEEIEEITELTRQEADMSADESHDKNSLTNLLTSDYAGRRTVGDMAGDIDRDTSDNNINANDYDDDDDDDDKLSIIVASYISDDYGCEDEDDTDFDDKKTLHAGGQKGGGIRSKLGAKSRRILPFGKRFSLRRKVNSANGSANRHQQQTALPDITDLKLNYKTCCEYRNAVQEKLPKYTGYLSEYGLSASQLAQRAERKQRKQRHLLQQTLKANEQELQKMNDNERAFTTWLRNKIRFFPINKTRNMFDVKKTKRKTMTGGLFGGNSSSSCNAKDGGSGICGGVSDSGGKQRIK